MYKPPKVKPLCPPESPPRYEDIPYAQVTLDDGSAHTLKMDIYQDLQQSEAGPCIIYYFGGGWMWGEYKQVTQKAVYCRDLVRLTKQGFTVVCPSYRLASQSIFPACIHDCKGVVRFLKAHAAQFHIDPERISVLGNSAGGHLAAMVAMSANAPEMEGEVGRNLAYSSAVKAAAIFYAPADIVEMARTTVADIDAPPIDLRGTEVDNVMDQNSEVVTRVLGYTAPEQNLWTLKQLLESCDEKNPDWEYIRLAQKCSPVNYAGPDCPPMIILHGGHDPLVPLKQSELLYKAMITAQGDATFVSYSGGGHGPSLGEEVDEIAYRFLMRRI